MVHGFFLRFLKSIGWYGFSYEFLVVLCFINVFKKLLLILNFKMLLYQRRPSEAFLCHRMVSFAPKKKKSRLSPMDLKTYCLERNSRLWLDSWQRLEISTKIIFVTSISGPFCISLCIVRKLDKKLGYTRLLLLFFCNDIRLWQLHSSFKGKVTLQLHGHLIVGQGEGGIGESWGYIP